MTAHYFYLTALRIEDYDKFINITLCNSVRLKFIRRTDTHILFHACFINSLTAARNRLAMLPITSYLNIYHPFRLKHFRRFLINVHNAISMHKYITLFCLPLLLFFVKI